MSLESAKRSGAAVISTGAPSASYSLVLIKKGGGGHDDKPRTVVLRQVLDGLEDHREPGDIVGVNLVEHERLRRGSRSATPRSL